MYQALYRSFRPETFDGILGQEHIVKILKNQIANGTAGHAYLFCGTRGTGKTSTARILAKGVNCTAAKGERPCGTCPNCIAIKDGVFLDVIEIDAASNNGVDNIRELRETVKYPPTAGRCKVYIIDEVHMLSIGAFNALLKTLEEPPENVMFILATTEPQKLPATIMSRCLRLDFRRVTEKKMREGMRKICQSLGVKISESALGLIAANADGSVRDALSLLDQCISSGGEEVSRQDVLEFLGTSGEEVFIEMTDYITHKKVAEALLLLNRIITDGKDVRQFMKDWISHYRSLLIAKYIKNPEDVLNISAENVERIREQSLRTDLADINRCITELSGTLAEAKWSTQSRILLELCIVKISGGGNAGSDIPELKKTEITENKPALIKNEKKVSAGSGPDLNNSAEKAEQEKKRPDKSVLFEKAEQDKEKSDKAKQDPEYKSIWHRVFEDSEADKAVFNILRKGSKLQKIEDNVFYVAVANEPALRYAKDNALLLEKLMEKHTGRKLHMECFISEDAFSEREPATAEEVKNRMENRLGIRIELK